MLLLGMVSGCSKEQNYRWIIYVGAKSTPSYDQIVVGEKILNLGVFGDGELGNNVWGDLEVEYDNGEKKSFTRGGCVSYIPRNSKLLSIKGEAKVPLFVFLVRAELDKNLNPSDATVTKKWKIPKGSFNIDPNKKSG